MDLLKKTIYLDLQNHLQKRVQNDQLFSCLVYDFLFAQLVIGPLYIFTWRGTWQNADALFDQEIFQGNLKGSTMFVLFFGMTVSGSLSFTQHSIKTFALKWSRPWFFLISRCFTITNFYGDLLMWKGIWGFFDYFAFGQINGTWRTSLCTCIISTIFLFMIRSGKAAVGPPQGIGIDRPKFYISISTFLSSTASDSYQKRLLDVFISVPVILVSIALYYGYWSGMDHMFDALGINLNKNSIYCTIFGVACGLLVFIGQFIFVWLYYRDKVTEKTVSMTRFQKLLRLSGYNLLIFISFIGSVASFRGIWNLTDIYFIPKNPLASRFVSQLVGMMYLFLFYSGSSLHGGVVKDNQNVMVPNFFLTYLLRNKGLKSNFNENTSNPQVNLQSSEYLSS